MPNPTYAALLRECADTLAQSDGSLARARKAAQLRALADLLERITPEVVGMADMPGTLDRWSAGMDHAIRALAAGSQGGEHTRETHR